MIKLKTHAALAAVLAGAVVLGVATPSFAGGNDAAVAAGVGFAAGTVVGAAAANANANGYYYNEPGYVYAPGPGYVYAPAPGYVYAPGTYAYSPGPTLGVGVNGDIGNDTYVNGRYVGSDPDPRIRSTLRAEERGGN